MALCHCFEVLHSSYRARRAKRCSLPKPVSVIAGASPVSVIGKIDGPHVDKAEKAGKIQNVKTFDLSECDDRRHHVPGMRFDDYAGFLDRRRLDSPPVHGGAQADELCVQSSEIIPSRLCEGDDGEDDASSRGSNPGLCPDDDNCGNESNCSRSSSGSPVPRGPRAHLHDLGNGLLYDSRRSKLINLVNGHVQYIACRVTIATISRFYIDHCRHIVHDVNRRLVVDLKNGIVYDRMAKRASPKYDGSAYSHDHMFLYEEESGLVRAYPVYHGNRAADDQDTAFSACFSEEHGCDRVIYDTSGGILYDNANARIFDLQNKRVFAKKLEGNIGVQQLRAAVTSDPVSENDNVQDGDAADDYDFDFDNSSLCQVDKFIASFLRAR
ncbi:hypothetical protein SEPCBS119000_006269 [Sporothrix epigloea]|uniref:Uncharacterized protein n=1 Tax=Sporothrix epigloea TaxID=1892477 RepID=A0ABP0E6B2_9PEZI